MGKDLDTLIELIEKMLVEVQYEAGGDEYDNGYVDGKQSACIRMKEKIEHLKKS